VPNSTVSGIHSGHVMSTVSRASGITRDSAIPGSARFHESIVWDMPR
jgi:hypothetical protein